MFKEWVRDYYGMMDDKAEMEKELSEVQAEKTALAEKVERLEAQVAEVLNVNKNMDKEVKIAWEERSRLIKKITDMERPWYKFW